MIALVSCWCCSQDKGISGTHTIQDENEQFSTPRSFKRTSSDLLKDSPTLIQLGIFHCDFKFYFWLSYFLMLLFLTRTVMQGKQDYIIISCFQRNKISFKPQESVS